MDTTKQVEAQPSIVLHGAAQLVRDAKRMEFLPMLFGERLMMLGEMTVYAQMSNMCSQYLGGLWDFVLVPGGGYMRPPMREHYDMYCPSNWFGGQVSADAAGIIVTLMALSHMSFKDQTDHCADRFYALRQFVDGHPEAVQIFRAID